MCFSRVGSGLTLRLDWKGLPGANTQAYYGHLLITYVTYLKHWAQVSISYNFFPRILKMDLRGQGPVL